MKQIPLTQGKFAIVDDEDYGWLMQWKWCFNNGYAVRHEHLGYVVGKRIRRRVYMHRYIMQPPSNMEIDHINGDKLDNSKSNLRVATASQNARNRKRHADSGSKYKGITWKQRYRKWQASIFVDGRIKHLGSFVSDVDAAAAYDLAATQHYGEFARINNVGADS